MYTAVLIFWIRYSRKSIWTPAVPSPSNGNPAQVRTRRYFFLAGVAFSVGYARRELILCIAAILFSAVLEISQLMIPGRHARLSDFLVDAFGACIGIVAVSLLRSMRVQPTT
jgi:VanZ family protein